MFDVKDAGFLIAILKMCDDIESYKIEYGSIEKTLSKRSGVNAVLMNLSQIGEYAGKISERTKNNYAAIDWKRIKGLRNIITHDYFGVDLEKIQSIISLELPELTQTILDIVRSNAKSGKIEPGLINAADDDLKFLRINPLK